MPLRPATRRSLLPVLLLTALLSMAPAARGQVVEVVVGVTPTCPYGLHACWPSAREGLSHLEGVQSVAAEPNGSDYTAAVRLAGDDLPDIGKWAGQFRSVVGSVHLFRGVEVTVDASVEEADGRLVLRTPGLSRPLILEPIKSTIQWDVKEGRSREPDRKERAALGQLARRRQEAGQGRLTARVTGPLKSTDAGLVMELRHFDLAPPPPASRPSTRPQH